MASTLINNGTYALNHGIPLTVSFTSTIQVAQFALPSRTGLPVASFLAASVVGGTGTTGVALEASLDGGTSWFGLTARSSIYSTTVLNSDPAAVAASSFDVQGLSAGAQLRVAVTGLTSGTANVTLLVD